LKLEGERMGVKLNAVAPLAWTRLTEDVLPAEMKERLGPEWIVPLVTLLASEKCPVNGRIYNVGGGYFGRAALLTGPKSDFSDRSQLTAEDIFQNLEKITRFEGGREYSDAVSFIQDFLGA